MTEVKTDAQKKTMAWVLESWFCAEAALLKRGLKPGPKEGQYQFMTSKGQDSLMDVLVALDRLASANIMSQNEAERFKQRICDTLVVEFTEKFPPSEGMMYRAIPMKSSMWDHLYLEIVPMNN